MPLSALIDNDILLKGSAFDLLAPLQVALGGAGTAGVLGSARFVLADRFARDARFHDADSARARFEAFLADATELEPGDDIVDLATTLEEAAADLHLPFDAGESLLCATAIQHAELAVLTGDKRAIASLEQLQESIAEVRALSGRLTCLEQVIEALVRRIGVETIRAGVCSELDMDRALTLCFQCPRGEDGHLDTDGLPSYIRHMREQAPTMLASETPF